MKYGNDEVDGLFSKVDEKEHAKFILAMIVAFTFIVGIPLLILHFYFKVI